MFRLLLVSLLVSSVTASLVGVNATCDAQKSEKSCMAFVEDGVSCSYCTAAATGTICLKETDAVTLPSSIFSCKYNSKLTASATCEGQTSKNACLATVQDGEKCAYCSSAAAGKGCYTESQSKDLPSSIFSCQYV